MEEEGKAYICDLDTCDWYVDVIDYLKIMVSPPHMIENEKRTVKLYTIRFFIIGGELWWRRLEGVLLKCVDKNNQSKF